MRRLVALIALLAALSAVLSACGGSDDSGTAASHNEAVVQAEEGKVEGEAEAIAMLDKEFHFFEEAGVENSFSIPGGCTCSIDNVYTDEDEIAVYGDGDEVLISPDEDLAINVNHFISLDDDPEASEADCLSYVKETLGW